MLSITTKQGDNGETRLYSGETVSKRSKRIQVCGEIDELVCILGVARASFNSFWDFVTGVPMCRDDALWENINDITISIQKHLFRVASEIATLPPKRDKLNNITNKDIIAIDKARKKLEKVITLPKGFIVPGDQKEPAYLDLARAVCRRCEREIVNIYHEGFIDNKNILIWMNRLSDLLYLMARALERNEYNLVK